MEHEINLGDFREQSCPYGTLMLVDPPYGISKKYATIDDEKPFYEWVKELLEWSNAKRNLIFAPHHTIYDWLPKIPRPDRILMWHRTFVIPNQRGMEWTYSLTPILQYKDDDAPWYGPKRNDREWHDCIDSHSSMGDIRRLIKLFGDNRIKHPAMTGTAIARKLLQGTTKEDDLVIDPMCGLGSIPVACIRENRRIWACEISEKYWEFALDWVNIENNSSKQKVKD